MFRDSREFDAWLSAKYPNMGRKKKFFVVYEYETKLRFAKDVYGDRFEALADKYPKASIEKLLIMLLKEDIEKRNFNSAKRGGEK